MHFGTAVALAALAAAAPGLGQPRPEETRTVTVCMDAGFDPAVDRAQRIASDVFARIGVKVQWRRDARPECAASGIAITIELIANLPVNERPGAVAAAFPFEAKRIQIFYDRVRKTVGPRRVPHLLAHVLLHEI